MSEAKGTFFSTCVGVLNNMLGAGMLALPFTLKRASLVPGSLVMILVGALNALTMIMIAQSCKLAKDYSKGESVMSFIDLSKVVFGPSAAYICSFVMVIYTFLSIVSYIILLSHSIPEIAHNVDPSPFVNFLANIDYMIPIMALLVLFPLSLQRNLASLRFTDTASVICILFIAGMVIVTALIGPVKTKDDPDAPVMASANIGIFLAFPIATVAFTLHYNIPKFWGELKGGTIKTFSLITCLCYAFAIILYTSVAISGYKMFGQKIKGDVLENFDTHYGPAIAARISILIVMTFTYPLVFNAVRASFIGCMPEKWRIHFKPPSERNIPNYSEGSFDPNTTWLQKQVKHIKQDIPHILLTFGIVTLSVIFSVIFPKIEKIFGYKGALGGTVLVYILPAIIYYVLVRVVDKPRVRALTGDATRVPLLTEAPRAPSAVKMQYSSTEKSSSGTDSSSEADALLAASVKDDSTPPALNPLTGTNKAALLVLLEEKGGYMNVLRDMTKDAAGLTALSFLFWGVIIMILGTLATMGVFAA